MSFYIYGNDGSRREVSKDEFIAHKSGRQRVYGEPLNRMSASNVAFYKQWTGERYEKRVGLEHPDAGLGQLVNLKGQVFINFPFIDI